MYQQEQLVGAMLLHSIRTNRSSLCYCQGPDLKQKNLDQSSLLIFSIFSLVICKKNSDYTLFFTDLTCSETQIRNTNKKSFFKRQTIQRHFKTALNKHSQIWIRLKSYAIFQAIKYSANSTIFYSELLLFQTNRHRSLEFEGTRNNSCISSQFHKYLHYFKLFAT